MKKIKYDTLRIFPYLLCNYKCKYCTAYTQFNTPFRYKEYELMTAQKWLEILNNKNIYELFSASYQIIISGGEPTLWKDFKILCDGLEYRNIVIYSNISKTAYNKLCSLEKPVKIYPSFHHKEEMKHGHYDNIHEAYRAWYRRLLDLKLCGHKIYIVHCPDDGSKEIHELSSWILKTKIEGDWNGEFYSPYLMECRVKSKEYRKVKCHTQHFNIAPDGSIYNCQAGLWSKREDMVIGNAKTINWAEFPEFVECNWCGACHPCAQQKAIIDMNDNVITDGFQYKPLLEQMKQRKVA